jgi:PmbA protein
MNPAAARLLARAQVAGAEAAEVFLSSGTEFSVKVFNREIDSVVSAESRGVGIRTLQDTRVGFAYTSDLSPASLDALADEALRNGRYNHADEANQLPPVAAAEPLDNLYSPGLDRIDPQRKIQFALDLERLTTSSDPRVKRVSDSVYTDGSGHVELANSLGLDAVFDRTVAYAMVEAIAEQDSEMQSGYAFTYGRDLDALKLEATAKEAAERAAGLLGAARVPTAKVPVVLDPYAGAMILGLLTNSFSGDAVLKRRSLLAGKVGQAVASGIVSIIDDARLPDGLASRPFDGEGVPTRRNELVKAGILQGFLHNTYTARRSGAVSTGSAVRSYKSVPEVGVSNLVLQPGSLSRMELLRRVGEGLYVAQLHGLHTVNTVSGEFSLGLTGHWIRGGELAQPVRELTIAGNLIELLQKVIGLANDPRFTFAGGFCGSPTVLIEELSVAGA